MLENPFFLKMENLGQRITKAICLMLPWLAMMGHLPENSFLGAADYSLALAQWYLRFWWLGGNSPPRFPRIYYGGWEFSLPILV